MYAKKEKDRSRLMKAALQEIPCDLTVSNVRYLNIFTGEIYPAQVDILDGVVVRVREEGQETACPSREIYDSGAVKPCCSPLGNYYYLHRSPRNRKCHGH